MHFLAATSARATRRAVFRLARQTEGAVNTARPFSCSPQSFRSGLPNRSSRPRVTILVRCRAFATSPEPLDKGKGKEVSSAASESGTVTPTEPELRESPYTIPNALTTLRLLSCPFLGWAIVDGQFELATGILVAGGLSDLADGWIARRFNMKSVLGTILDPAADKALMTTLVVTLAWKGLLPLPLAVLILGRDVALSISAFYYRYISLPEPKTFKRYWDFSIPSAEVRPTTISKYNTALQLMLMGVTTVSPLIGADISLPLQALQWTVAGTTLWSGLSYVGSKDAVRILSKRGK